MLCSWVLNFTGTFKIGEIPLGSDAPSTVTKASMPRTELESTGVLQPHLESGVEGNLPPAEVSPSHAPQLKVVHTPMAWLHADPWEYVWAPVLLPMLRRPAKS